MGLLWSEHWSATPKLKQRATATLMARGQMVELVSNFTGHIEALPGYDVIKQMPSFNFMEVGGHIAVGQDLELTIDLFTCAGAVILCHHDKQQVAADEAK